MIGVSRAIAVVATGLLMSAVPAAAQQRTLEAEDYGQWETLGAFELDPTGRWLVSAITRIDGERELRLRRSDASGEAQIFEHGRSPVFSADGRWMAYRKGASSDEAEAAEEPIEDRLALVDLESGVDSVLFNVSGFEFRDDGAWIAAHGIPASDSVGGDLIIMNPTSGAHTLVGNVDDFAWQDDGPLVAATLRTAWGGSNGVVLFEPEAGNLRTIESGDAEYVGLTWRDGGRQLAVMRTVEDEAYEEPSHDLLFWEDPTATGAPRVLSANGRSDMPSDSRITPYAGISFSEDGNTIFVGVRPWELAVVEESPTEDGMDSGDGGPESDEVEPADVQVWHWDDDQILRAQEYGAARIARQTLTAAWDLRGDRFLVLGDELEEPVTVVAGGRWGLVADYEPYLFERRFGAGTADWYRVDPGSGDRALIAQGLESSVQSHADLDRVLVYEDDQWSVVDLDDLDRRAVGAGRSFTQALEDFDYPGPRPNWGLAGWVADGSAALLHDKHDVWFADLEDGSIRPLTNGAPANDQYRVANLDPEQSRFAPALVEAGADVTLSVRNLRTKTSGYARVDAGGDRVWTMQTDARVTGLSEVLEADRYALRMERWDDSPDVFVGESLDDLVQVTKTNPFQDDFAWGHAELLDYTTDAGHDLQAILVYPADFQEGERYPLILYQYERLSQNLHTYNPPSERQYYNYQAWSQAGYFVLMPDIVYEPGRPGPSALDAVDHALDAAVATGHVDSDGMGLIGHSWGGYQAAYLPTRTNRFAASVAGAAITNFMSFMGAVHWNGGLPETGHWETGQARMAAPYWDDVEGHLESSPAHFISDLETPMLLMHGDSDGVVDFYQGLEFYNYARRAGKEVVLLVYPGADHGLSDESQQIDYHRRILQWFGHHLKGEPAAEWITDGESWVARERRLGG